MANENRRVFFVFRNPSVARLFLSAWSDLHPKDEASIYYTPPMGAAIPSIPRDLPISAVPMIRPPELKLGRWAKRMSEISPGDLPPPLKDGIKEVAERSDLVVFTAGNHQDVRNFFNLLSFFGANVRHDKIRGLRFWSTRQEDVKEAVQTPLGIDNPIIIQSRNYGDAKYYFDYNYAINAMPVFGEIFRRIGAPKGANFISKYALQLLLHWLHCDLPPMSEGKLLSFMQQGMGRTKYTESEMGSAMSRVEICQQLRSLGMIEEILNAQGKRNLFAPGNLARSFISHLHKDMRDPDLPGRIDHWANSWPQSKQVMDRYIRTVFGKQKRFMSRQ